jgi:hypothetical protein
LPLAEIGLLFQGVDPRPYVEWRNPITGIAGCCARIESGDAIAPLSSVMNSRRFMYCPLAAEDHNLPHHWKSRASVDALPLLSQKLT